jgi:hypothetical protein
MNTKKAGETAISNGKVKRTTAANILIQSEGGITALFCCASLSERGAESLEIIKENKLCEDFVKGFSG